MKTKKVAGHFDLGPEFFAHVGNPEDPATWKCPLFIPGNAGLTRNMIKNAVERFATTKIPDEQRAEVWRLIAGAAKAHGIKVGAQPSALPVNAHPETAQPLDALDMEVKEARALGSLYADRLLEKIEMEWVK